MSERDRTDGDAHRDAVDGRCAWSTVAAIAPFCISNVTHESYTVGSARSATSCSALLKRPDVVNRIGNV